MLKKLLKFVLLVGVIMALPYIIPGIVVTGTVAAIIAAAVLGLINTFLKPVLNILSLPMNVLTLGLFGILLNLILFWLASLLVPGFDILTFTAGVIASLVVGFITWLLNRFL